MLRICIYCQKTGGNGPRELRPYGPGGADVCYQCAFQSAEREKEAKKQLGIRLVQPGPYKSRRSHFNTNIG